MPQLPLLDLEPQADDVVGECTAAMRASPRQLPCKFFYDRRGSQLFDRICELPEYYPTRTELAILHEHAPAMAARLGPRCLLIELGSGSSVKVRKLLDELVDPVGYMPIDISREHLLDAAGQIADAYPELDVQPICADYAQPMTLPEPTQPPQRRVAYFPGSTIGNLHPDEARRFLARVAGMVQQGGGLLIGVDLRKEPAVLEAAYNDAAGVTAAFNLNLLHRINREVGAGIDVDAFEHQAVWNGEASRVEMHLVARSDQHVALNGDTFHITVGESIRTECSYKHTLASFASLASEAFEVVDVWTDARQWFSVQYLEAK
ncbi:L-histidine N(alpha)-methyltransferase [Phycisphaerales bacterium AB-hyl4]|uniref:L-histidine N(Alpha)-methyltransferase n=1 Tax=Natronomicrosphaera hydrolytica TaxID=3242702 RepID=A0ABV4U0C9_9BACT